jgi:hypothetical protein
MGPLGPAISVASRCGKLVCGIVEQGMRLRYQIDSYWRSKQKLCSGILCRYCPAVVRSNPHGLRASDGGGPARAAELTRVNDVPPGRHTLDCCFCNLRKIDHE